MRQRGITLIELLVAIAVSGLVLVLVSRLFLSGHAQSLLRSRESELLKERLLLNEAVEKRLIADSVFAVDLPLLRERHPHLDSLSLQWFVADSVLKELAPVRDGERGSLAVWTSHFSWGTVQHAGTGSLAR